MAARRFNQTSKFGAILDMAVDRFSQACLLGVLYGLYPNYGYVFLLMIALDLVSHWFQVFSTQYCAESHHKTAVSHFRLLDIYYKTPYVLFVMCFTSEVHCHFNT
jgi:CDP-diacylglycerol--inositol 3-phosphatidyltransferase